MQSHRRWHTQDGYHPSPQQRYFEAQKPKKRAKVQLFFGLTKYFLLFFQKDVYPAQFLSKTKHQKQ